MMLSAYIFVAGVKSVTKNSLLYSRYGVGHDLRKGEDPLKSSWDTIKIYILYPFSIFNQQGLM
jgi:hypothetical protein